MAALVQGQFAKVFDDDGISSKVALYTCRNVSAGDTVDVGTDFSVVKRAGLMSDTADKIAAITTITGTNLTFPTGAPTLANDGCFLMVFGVDSYDPVT